MDLSKDAKLLWVYFITKCDHAGMLKLNTKLCKVQTDIKDLNEIIKQLGNRLVTVSKHLYFIPKFIEFQYPNFPNSKVRQQSSAIDILLKYDLLDKDKLTVSKVLGNTYVNGNDNDNDNDNDNVKKADFDFSFLPIEWNDIFMRWVRYKKSRNESYKTQQSLEACYRNLIKLSMDNIDNAVLIIDQSMGNNWQGLFPLRNGQKIQSGANPKMSTKYINNGTI
jgi:hypothetical protein